MKLSIFTVCAAIAVSSNALPSHHYINVPVAAGAAPAAFSNEQTASSAPITFVSNSAADARAEREARREERRKEWQAWAHQEGANGVPNGTNFVAQVLDGVSGIVDSALGPLYSVLSS
ncbi:hypothetical protein COEREDRAFT_14760 [Coemansia reversa NRRL 1564]|uniref:Uncharacterized protein n=1 Tax=Coemansia reversa (strain ATCC 12441 / NRRL 1564) TaxID=763665 RepID=A0A2G5BE43_COERN|nr:hypothetical protein COEREDRAFT_14760 [Coemansia reversa NRRL 1564]|eukprot:PIA17289.1 hypothetical protein COEREDRAFT_14760 [Coemansia reversa NRRL 1564]